MPGVRTLIHRLSKTADCAKMKYSKGHTNKPLILAASSRRWLPSWLRPLPPSTSSCTLWAMRTTEEASGSSSLGKRSKCLKLRTSPNKWSIQLLPSVTALVVFSQVFRLVCWCLGVHVCVVRAVVFSKTRQTDWRMKHKLGSKGFSYWTAEQCNEVRDRRKGSMLGRL